MTGLHDPDSDHAPPGNPPEACDPRVKEMVAAHDELVTGLEDLLEEQAPRTLDVFGLRPSVSIAAEKLVRDDDATKVSRLKKLIFTLRLANLVAGDSPVVQVVKQRVDEVLRRHAIPT